MLGTRLAPSAPWQSTAEPQDPRGHERYCRGGWSTTSFLQAPTPFLDAVQYLLSGLIDIQPAWSTPEPSASPALCNLLTKAVIKDSFIFQQVLWESQVPPSWQQADWERVQGLAVHADTIKPKSASSDLLRRVQQGGPCLTCQCPGCTKSRQGCLAFWGCSTESLALHRQHPAPLPAQDMGQSAAVASQSTDRARAGSVRVLGPHSAPSQPIPSSETPMHPPAWAAKQMGKGVGRGPGGRYWAENRVRTSK